MASEDVIERAHKVLAPTEDGEIRRQSLAGMLSLIFDLAAEVRGLRKDKAMLDFILRCGPILLVDTDESGRLRKSWDDIETREDVIAAMRDSCQLPKEDE